MKIGFFDSGIGGITVLHEALKIIPNEEYIYYADIEHVPYGNQPKEIVKEYVLEGVEFMAEHDLKGLVIACNTATSVAVSELRKRYKFPIIGMEPAVKPAVQGNSADNKRVLVLATHLTLKEEKFKQLLLRVDKDHIVDFLALTELVKYAESFNFSSQEVESFLKEKLNEYNLRQYNTIVLGCTHFVFFKKVIKKLIPDSIELIDGNRGTVLYLKKKLNENKTLEINSRSDIMFYDSGQKLLNPKKYYKLLKMLNDGKI